MRRVFLMLVLPLALVAGCERSQDIFIDNTPTAPTPPAVTVAVVEMRVLGNASSVRIRHVNPIDGLSQVNTVLPFIFSLRTDQDSMFLSLEVAPLGYHLDVITPFLQAQIFVNGVLFREGSSSDFLFNTLAVSGTWRK